MCNNNKHNCNNKNGVKLYSIVLLVLGAVLGILIAPTKGDNIRSQIVYRLKDLGNRLAKLILNFFNKEVVYSNDAKIEGEKLVSQSQKKANELLLELEKIN